MKVYPGVRLNAFKDAEEQRQMKVLDDALRDITAGLSRSVLPGTQPAANPVPAEPPPGTSTPLPVIGDMLYGQFADVWGKLSIGSSGSILSVSGGIPAWATVLSLLPVHDHSSSTTGGNIPEASITDGAILARLSADETVGGSWFLNGIYTKIGAQASAGTYTGAGILLTPDGGGIHVQLDVSASQSSDGALALPNCSGGSIILVGNTETLSMLNKIMSTGTKLRTNAAGSACVFQDSTGTTKQFAIDLAGCTAGTLSVLDINATTAKTWTLQDVTGTIYQTGGTDVAVADGGTGAGTATAGFNALSPVTTRGDLIIRDASNNIRLAVGGASTVLKSDGTDPSWGTIGAAHIDNRTRTVFLPAAVFGSSEVMTIVGTAPSAYAGYPFLDGVGAIYAQTTVMVPKDYVTSGAVSWKMHYTNGGTSNNGTHWDVYYQVIENIEDITAANDATMSADDAPGTTLDGLNIFEVGTTNTSLVAGSVLRLTVSRDPTNGGDTNAGDMYFIGLQFDYTSDM